MHSDTNPNLLHVCVLQAHKHITSFITLPFNQGLYLAWSQIEQCSDANTSGVSLLKQMFTCSIVWQIIFCCADEPEDIAALYAEKL